MKYSTGKTVWRFGEHNNNGDTLLGPCPTCGTPCISYGGGFRCLALNCQKSFINPSPFVGHKPTWWEEAINVYIDGGVWCAVYDDFVNLQESMSGFGGTPQDAVDKLLEKVE